MDHRHLDYPTGTPVSELGSGALDDLLERGDLSDWTALAAEIRRDPHGPVADTVLRLCAAHTMYGTSVLWTAWIGRLRRADHSADHNERRTESLAGLRRRRGLSQSDVAARLGISQSDVSKLERRGDLRLSTIRAYVEATGGALRLVASDPVEDVEVQFPGQSPL